MPIHEFRVLPDRVDFDTSLTKNDVQALIAESGLKVLQCSSPVQMQTWELLNREFFTQRPDVDMKGLKDLRSLEHAPALEECALLDTMNYQPKDCIPLLKNPNLKRVSSWFGSHKRNTRFMQLAQEHAVEVAVGLDEFQYV